MIMTDSELELLAEFVDFVTDKLKPESETNQENT